MNWRPVVRLESAYEVSSEGNVRRIGNSCSRKTKLNGYGYEVVLLGTCPGTVGKLVHRLVVESFIGPIPKGMQVNHKNLNRADNRLSNLEIVTPLENVQHSIKMRQSKCSNVMALFNRIREPGKSLLK
jgi:hypothetical protein